jgi:hypothetical protein
MLLRIGIHVYMYYYYVFDVFMDITLIEHCDAPISSTPHCLYKSSNCPSISYSVRGDVLIIMYCDRIVTRVVEPKVVAQRASAVLSLLFKTCTCVKEFKSHNDVKHL